MKLAVIRTGGKQYKVKAGDKLRVEKLATEEGKDIKLDILLMADGDKVEIGTPMLEDKVEAKVIRQFRDKKIRVVKYKNKTRYHKVYGHRHHLTELEITKV
jgi:large subunit ribosomal protein L21